MRGSRGADVFSKFHFDLDRLVALCPPCHARTHAPWARGRLVIIPIGNGRFTVEVARGR